MKKTLKIAAVLAAAVMAMGFVSCSNDDAEDLGTLLIVKDYQEKKEAAAAAAAAAAASSSNGTEATVKTDSWDLSKAGTFTISGYDATKTKNASTGKNDWSYAASTAITSTAAATYLTSDYSYDGASGNYTLVLSKYTGTGVGTTKGGLTAEPAWASTTTEVEGPYFKGATTGVQIKRDALKIEGIKGKVKVTVNWMWNKKNGNAGDRSLEVTVGTGTTVSTPVTATGETDESKTMTPYTTSFDGGDDGTTLYIGATNELTITSIKIEAQ